MCVFRLHVWIALTLSLLKRQNAQRLEQIDRQIVTVEAAIAMPELGSLEAGQAANLAGLAPIARQSGRWAGRSFIRGGRADGRQALIGHGGA